MRTAARVSCNGITARPAPGNAINLLLMTEGPQTGMDVPRMMHKARKLEVKLAVFLVQISCRVLLEFFWG